MMKRLSDASYKFDEIVQFPHHKPIELVYSNAIKYYKCNKYDSQAIQLGNTWHQIVVHHKDVLKSNDRKQIVLDAIFEAVEGEELYPVAYRLRKDKDMFLVRQCNSALDKLFKKNLRIQISDGRSLNIEVLFNIAIYKVGQLSPLIMIPSALTKLFCSYKGHKGILNLSDFANHKEFFDITVNLGNRGVLERIFDNINKNDELLRKINGLVLSDNNITTLAPIKIFNGSSLVVLDVRNNKLKSTTRLCKDLINIKAEDLFLCGNPLLNNASYPDGLRPISKNFRNVDNKPFDKIFKEYTPMHMGIDLSNDGYRIDWSNKSEINNYKSSNYWHAVIIPDPEHNYDQNCIIVYFFVTASPELCELYPCYYKYGDGEHQFLLRDCFEQLKYLVEERSVQIIIPSSVNSNFEQIIHFYLRMNVCAFERGHVELIQALDKAVSSRFRIMDRLLDLSNFQSAEGLEHIIVHLSSPKILERVLTVAARRYLDNCVDLRLSNNFITSANMARVLSLMKNLKSLDLGHNWIHELSEISELSTLKLVSLRLDGNPLCSKFSLAGEYIDAIKNEFPTLKRLDNKEIPSNAYFCSQKNYLISMEGYDFVEQFITRFFKLYESNDRAKLRDIYHPHAILTITCDFPKSHRNADKNERYSKYENFSRNLLERSGAKHTMYIGQLPIIEVLLQLPLVEHDMLSFSIDTIFYNEQMVMLVVHGLFMDQASTMMGADMLLAFTRTFILQRTKGNAGALKCGNIYKITNESFHVYNPSTAQQKNAFQYLVTPKIEKTDATEHEKDIMLVVFQEISGLKTIWCNRCLEDGKWNLKEALKVFINLCDKKEIPKTAFK